MKQELAAPFSAAVQLCYFVYLLICQSVFLILFEPLSSNVRLCISLILQFHINLQCSMNIFLYLYTCCCLFAQEFVFGL